MSSSSPVKSFNFEAKSQEAQMGRCVYSVVNSPPNTKCTTFSQKLMLGKILDGEFKLKLCIRELDNDDVDVKPDSTDEDSPPILHTSALTNELWCSVERTLVALDEIQVNVTQKSRVLEVAKCCRYLLQTC